MLRKEEASEVFQDDTPHAPIRGTGTLRFISLHPDHDSAYKARGAED